MSTNLTGSKTILAKLMATENFTVEHMHVKTARFDIESRVLTCPIWKDMDGDLYDLLMGHEVGHALFTPLDGAHEALSNRGTKYKRFLNIVEDARIEKLIKRKYPGLKRSFVNGYVDLLKRDFFGINDLNGQLDVLNLMDRINIYCKVGNSFVIKFNDEERALLNEVETLETFDDSVRVTTKIWDYVKEKEQKKAVDREQFEELLEKLREAGMEPEVTESSTVENPDSDETSEPFIPEPDDEIEKSEQSQAGQPDEQDGDEESSEDDESEDDSESEDGDEESTSEKSSEETEDEEGSAVGNKTSEEGCKSDDEEGENPKHDPDSVTDKAFRDKEQSLCDTAAKPYLFLDIPEAVLENIVVPNKPIVDHFEKMVKKDMVDFLTTHRQALASPYITAYITPPKSGTLNYHTIGKFLNNRFLKRNSAYIALLVKEFEMRKNATQYSRQLESNSGELDTRRLDRYRYSNDIFRKITEAPKGKNHGMIMFMDMSGSMDYVLKNTIEQLLVLTTFCRKVGIEFEVYGFNDHSSGTKYAIAKNVIGDGDKFVAKTTNTLMFKNQNFHLKSLISSDLPQSQYHRAMMMLLIWAATQTREKYNGDAELKEFIGDFTMNSSRAKMQLSGTPFSETVIASKAIIQKFKIKTRADIINVVYLTDGDGSSSIQMPKIHASKYVSEDRYNIGLVDPKTKKSVMLKRSNLGNAWQTAFTELVALTTNCHHIGFYIGSISDIRYRLGLIFGEGDNLAKHNALIEKDGYTKTPHLGYHSYYYMPMATKIENDELNVEDNSAPDKILSAFLTQQNKKKSTRAMCSSFAKEIAA